MSVITDLELEFEALYDKAKVAVEEELASLHVEAQALEAKVKTELVLLRQRAANLASDAEVEAEKLVIEAKLFLDKVVKWIDEIEGKLSTRVKDYNTGAKFEDER